MLSLIKENKFLFILVIIYLLSVLFVKPYNSINSLTFPVNDEWYYALPILNLLDLKKLIIAEGMAAWSVPQIILGYLISNLFGFSFFNLRLLIIFFSILNIFLIYVYLTKFLKFDNLKTTILISTFIFFPGIYLSSITFMSETIFFTFFILCLILLENFKSKQNILNFLFLNLSILLLFLQRQIGVFLIIYLFYIYFFEKKNYFYRRKEILIICMMQSLFFIFFNYLINYNIGQTNPYSFSNLNYKNLYFIIYNIPQILMYLGFCSIPYLFLVDRPSISFKNYKAMYYFLTLLIIFAIFILYFRFDKYMPYFGNVFSKYGTFRLDEALPGKRDLFFVKEFYFILSAICLISILNLLILTSSKKFNDFLEIIKQPLYFFSTLIFIFSIIIFKNFNDRYIYVLLFCTLIYLNTFHIKLKFNLANKFSFIFCFVMIFSFFLVSVLTARDMFRWNEASWTLTNDSINKYNLNLFNIMAGHTWNWEKYRYFSKETQKKGLIKYSNIIYKNNYIYNIKFGKYEDSLDFISYDRMNKKMFISLNKVK
jgi:hypothetical protein